MTPRSDRGRLVEALLGVAASVILLIMMGLTFVDVAARYVFNRPLAGAFEVTELLLLVLIFAGLPLVSHADEHVTMDFIDRTQSAAILFFLAWQVWIKASRIAGYGDTTDVLRIVIGPFVYFMSLMIGLAGLIHVYKIFARAVSRASQATT